MGRRPDGPENRDALAAWRNAMALAVARAGLVAAGHALRIELAARIASYRAEQACLRARYRIDAATPIHAYDAEVERSVEAFAARHPGTRFAYTSGTTSRPKKIAFTPARLRAIREGSFSVAARTLLARGVRRASIFVLSSLKDDDSLSTLLLSHGGRRAPWLPSLVMPSKALADPALAPLVREFGATAARVLVLAAADPGLIYSTNPSTLAVFLREVHERWPAAAALARAFERERGRFAGEVEQALRRVAQPGWRARLATIAAARTPPPLRLWLPSLEVYSCWDGGYVRPFLEEVERHLAPTGARLVPMYSMATETVETLTWFDRAGAARFLPIAPGVLYEFVPEGAQDDPARLIAAADLEPGKTYAMVASDAHGLRRYQTEDLFLCRARVREVPDLRFLRRRGLAYSFTGEKLTGEQLVEAYARLRVEVPALRDAAVQMTCIPSRPPGAPLPGYRLLVAHPGAAPPAGLDLAALGPHLDRVLGGLNRELAAKLATGRLAPTSAEAMPYDRLAARLDRQSADPADLALKPWESQFKLLPLYRMLWEEIPATPVRVI